MFQEQERNLTTAAGIGISYKNVYIQQFGFMLTMFNQEISGRQKRQPLFWMHIDCSGYILPTRIWIFTIFLILTYGSHICFSS